MLYCTDSLYLAQGTNLHDREVWRRYVECWSMVPADLHLKEQNGCASNGLCRSKISKVFIHG